MGEAIVLTGFCLLFLWGWRRVYLHVMRKGGRPVVAHLLGLLLSLFPARFFVYAAFAIAPPEGSEPVSSPKAMLFCGLFVISLASLCILTRKRPVPLIASTPAASSPENDQPDAS